MSEIVPGAGRDAYVRLSSQLTQVFGDVRQCDLLFIDLVADTDVGGLRSVPIGPIAQERTILIRARPNQREPITTLLRRFAIGPHSIFFLEQRPGEPLGFTTPEGDEASIDLSVAKRARAVELRALLEWGDAFWRPSSFHFELPSGLHTDSFVRVADVVKIPHDAYVIASWLTPNMGDGIGVVIDTGSMTVIVAAVETILASKGWRLGHVAVLDQYPRTDLDAIAAVANAGGFGTVLGLLSISSSGGLRDRLWNALNQGDLDGFVLHVLIETSDGEAGKHMKEIEQWLPHPGADDLPVRPSIQAGRCELCRDPNRAPVVRITPTSFRPLLPSDRVLLMPDPDAARTSRRFWTICDEAGAVGLEEPPAIKSSIYRNPSSNMNVRIRFERLVADEAFRHEVASRLAEEWHEPASDLVLVPEDERQIDGFDDIWATIAPTVAPNGTLMEFPLETQWTSDELIEAVQSASQILVFGLGIVTGHSMQLGVTGVQRLRRTWGFDTRGLVVHARPTTLREWETLRNSLANRLHHLWLTFLPDRSPLHDEWQTLEDLRNLRPEEISADVASFINERRTLCAGASSVETTPVFWGSRLHHRVTPNSIFGDNLSGPAIYAAVGAAIASRRARFDRTPSARLARFEMPAISRSYYDPLILASVIRWVMPHEFYWGDDPQASERVVGEMLARAEHTSADWLTILVAELGLAAAQGKVPRPGVRKAHAYAAGLLAGNLDLHARTALETGVILMSRTHGLDDAAVRSTAA